GQRHGAWDRVSSLDTLLGNQNNNICFLFFQKNIWNGIIVAPSTGVPSCYFQRKVGSKKANSKYIRASLIVGGGDAFVVQFVQVRLRSCFCGFFLRRKIFS